MFETFVKIFTPENVVFMLKGAKVSITVAVFATFFGTVFGVIAASCKISRSKVLQFIGNFYVELIRGTPMLLQMSFFYLGLPMLYQMVTGNYISVNPLFMGIAAISVNSGAYSCELIRSAINSIDKGQWEAGMSVGLNHSQIMKLIILPQSFKRIIPPLVNEFITLIKDSSLVSTIGVVDLMKTSSILGARYYNYFFPMIGVGVIYLIMTLIVSKLATMLERKMAESD